MRNRGKNKNEGNRWWCGEGIGGSRGEVGKEEGERYRHRGREVQKYNVSGMVV